MGTIEARRENLWRLLEMLNAQLEECGYTLRYEVEKAGSDRGILYMLRNAADRRSMGDWMTTNETIRALYAMHQMLPALHGPTPYQRMMEELERMNNRMVDLELPYRFRIEGPHGGKFTLSRLTTTDGSGKLTVKSTPQYTEQGMIDQLQKMLGQVDFLHGTHPEEAEA